MFAPRAFCNARRSAGLWSGLGPPDFTAIAMSLLMRVKAFAILFQRANIVALRVSKMRPMVVRALGPRCAGARQVVTKRAFIAPTRACAPVPRAAGGGRAGGPAR